MSQLALLLYAKGLHAEAEPLMRRAVEILERSLVPGHPWTQKGRENLEGLLTEIAEGRERPEAG